MHMKVSILLKPIESCCSNTIMSDFIKVPPNDDCSKYLPSSRSRGFLEFRPLLPIFGLVFGSTAFLLACTIFKTTTVINDRIVRQNLDTKTDLCCSFFWYSSQGNFDDSWTATIQKLSSANRWFLFKNVRNICRLLFRTKLSFLPPFDSSDHGYYRIKLLRKEIYTVHQYRIFLEPP